MVQDQHKVIRSEVPRVFKKNVLEEVAISSQNEIALGLDGRGAPFLPSGGGQPVASALSKVVGEVLQAEGCHKVGNLLQSW